MLTLGYVAFTLLLAGTVPGTIELFLLTLFGVLPVRRTPIGRKLPPVAIVVPAHDEELGISQTLQSLSRSIGNDPSVEVVVVADNCTDETASRARECGVEVLERHDPLHRGKGFALDFAFSKLFERPLAAVIVVDADTVVAPDAIRELRRHLAAGADAVQSRYTVANPNASLRTRLLQVALWGFNVLRPRGRERVGFSSGILGNGFGLTRRTLQLVPYEAASVVEDLEYHLKLVKAGLRVRFVDTATVQGEMPSSGPGTATQRSRWEGGRLRMLTAWGPKLLAQIARGELRLIEPLLDLLLLPLAFHVTLLLAMFFLPIAASRVYASVALAVVVMHVAAAVWVGGGGLKDVRALLGAPFYMFWKFTLVGSLVRNARRNSSWVRTARQENLREKV